MVPEEVRRKGPKVREEGLLMHDMIIEESESPDQMIISPFKLKTEILQAAVTTCIETVVISD